MAKKFTRSLCWLRRDLRLEDHRALSEAINSSSEVILVFIFDSHILSPLSKLQKGNGDRRLEFICQALEEIKLSLEKMNGRIIIEYGDPTVLIPQIIKDTKANALFFNRDYEPYALDRDKVVMETLLKRGVDVRSFKDHVIFEKNEIRKGDGDAYKVFTPYKNKWLEKFSEKGGMEGLKSFSCKKLKDVISDKWPIEDIGPRDILFKNINIKLLDSPLNGTRISALNRLKEFQEKKLVYYKDQRDIIPLDGTSLLSVYIRHGLVSIRELVNTGLKEKSEGHETWLSELIWREFYQMILAEFPHVAMGPFKPQYNKIKWDSCRVNFQKWCDGQTGYPIIDSAMRCLNETGIMHNRLRMVTASFLCKTLLINWRWGESYFAQKLLDFDLAANNGGWQWSSSSGCDAQPYFRIFNPYNQSEKFDKDGEFIKKYCPELSTFSPKLIHNPSKADMIEQSEANCIIGQDYPMPIVNYKKNREKALAMYSVVRS